MVHNVIYSSGFFVDLEVLHGKSHLTEPNPHALPSFLALNPVSYDTPGLIDRSRPLEATTAAVAKSCNADTYTSANPKRVAFPRQFYDTEWFPWCRHDADFLQMGLTSADKLETTEYNRRTPYRST
jgi:hypothetical protein